MALVGSNIKKMILQYWRYCNGTNSIQKFNISNIYADFFRILVFMKAF